MRKDLKGSSDIEWRLERLRWQVDRGEAWINNADTKAAILLGLNGAIITGVLSVDPEIVTAFLNRNLISTSLALVFALSELWSCGWAAFAVLPKLGKPQSGGSIFHFLDARAMSLSGFSTVSREMTPWNEMDGLEHQVHTLSTIAADKFTRLRLGVFGLLLGLVSGLVMIFVHDVF